MFTFWAAATGPKAGCLLLIGSALSFLFVFIVVANFSSLNMGRACGAYTCPTVLIPTCGPEHTHQSRELHIRSAFRCSTASKPNPRLNLDH